jgi:Ulp1 family protease
MYKIIPILSCVSQITRKKLQCMRTKQLLNDELINFYMLLLQVGAEQVLL